MSYPSALATALTLLTAINNMRLNLADDIAIDATEVEVDAAMPEIIPNSGSFGLGSEIFHYSSRTSLKFTIDQRGYDTTTPAVHYKTVDGGEIFFGPHAAFHNLSVAEIIAIETALGINLSNVVKVTGNETIAGIKTFSSSPIVPTPTTDMQAATKLLADLYITTIASSATPTPARGSRRNMFTVTALAEAATIAAPTGTPADGDTLLLRFKDNGTARAIGHNAIYRNMMATLLTTTVISKTCYELFIYNSADSKWDCMAAGSEA